jgi:hypothetical protein
MIEQRSDEYDNVYKTLNEIKKKLTELSLTDLSKIHVGIEWTWMPYVKDHIDFLIEQTDGILQNIHDSPPPVAKNIDAAIDNDNLSMNE